MIHSHEAYYSHITGCDPFTRGVRKATEDSSQLILLSLLFSDLLHLLDVVALLNTAVARLGHVGQDLLQVLDLELGDLVPVNLLLCSVESGGVRGFQSISFSAQ